MTDVRQLALGLRLTEDYHAEDFLVSASNREAHGWITRWPDWPSPQFLLYGPAGSGKTHLSHLWMEQSRAVPLAPTEIDASPALLENIERYPETDLFHFLNRAKTGNLPVLMTMTAGTPTGNFTLPDLTSRLAALPGAALSAPDDGLLGAVLQKYFSDRQLRVGPEIVAFLLTRMERSFEAARALVQRIDQAALTAKKPVTLPFLRQILAEWAE